MATQKGITWTLLNNALRDADDEKVVQRLLSDETKGKNRPAWKLRIHQRLNKLRRMREQKAIVQ